MRSDAVAGQPLAQRLDHRDAAGHRRFERQRHAALLGRSGELRAVHRQHRLVGGDHRLAGGERRLHQGARRAVGAADQFDHHVDRRIGGERDRVLVPAQPGQRHAAVARAVAGRHRGDRDRPAGARGDDVGVVAQQLQDAAADRAEAGDRDRKRPRHSAGFGRLGRTVMLCPRRMLRSQHSSHRSAVFNREGAHRAPLPAAVAVRSTGSGRCRPRRRTGPGCPSAGFRTPRPRSRSCSPAARRRRSAVARWHRRY